MIKELDIEEQKILSRFDNRISQIKNHKTKQLKGEIKSRVKEAGYCQEDWQAYYSAESIFEALQAKMWYGDLTKNQNEYVSSWSWAAFFGAPIIWPFGSKLYLWMFGYLIPFYGIYLLFYLGKNGRRLSYQKGWQSFDEFRKRQKRLGLFIAILLGIGIGGQLLAILL